jgi:hypothetical protein
MELEASVVTDIFSKCLFREGEDVSNVVLVDGITVNVGFHPDRLNQNRTQIIELLNELPKQFKKNGGGGWSFLQAFQDKDGRHWGGHKNMQELILLGIAIGKVEFLLPREMWSKLPGRMPYIVILD